MSNILLKDSSKVSYTQILIVSKKFDNFAKMTLRVTETGPSRIHSVCIFASVTSHSQTVRKCISEIPESCYYEVIPKSPSTRVILRPDGC